MDEIELPIELGRIILDGAEETKLGDKKGAIRQYRKGNLHIENMIQNSQSIQIGLIQEKIH